MADVPFATNLLPSYQTPQAMIQAGANTANTQANTQNTNAQTNLIGSQASGQDIQNQLLQSQLNYRQQLPGAMAGATQSATAPPAPAAPGTLGDGGLDADQIQAHANAKFYVNPAWTPQEVYALQVASRSGVQGATENVSKLHDIRVQNLQNQATNAATNSYDTSFDVQDAPKGAALERLNRSQTPEAQQAAAGITAMAKAKGWTPEQTDNFTREVAKEIGGSSFVFSKYAADAKRDTDGVLKDVRGRQVLESTQAGLSAPQASERQIKLAEPVTYGDQLPKPIGQAGGLTGPSPPNTAPPAPQGPPKVPTASASPAAVTDPVEKKALGDTSYRIQPLPKPTSQSELAANTDAAKATVAARQSLKTESDQATVAAAQAQTYLKAAKDIMDSGGVKVGAYGSLISQASALLPGQHVDANNYQELGKYLNNAEIAAAKGNYGSGLTEKELELQLSGASPSVDKTPGALRDLVDANLRNTQYTLDTAGRAVRYLNAGNDPTNFKKYNQQYWNQAQNVNKDAGGPVKVASPAEARALKPGTSFITPDGRQLVR
jgi:hypothetical protein